MTRLGGLGFPHSMVANLRYVDSYSFTVTTGSISKQYLRWNSTFDPDSSGIGHQPLYRDTFASIYNHYAVIRSSISVTFVNTSDQPVLIGIVTEDDDNSSTDARVLMEQSMGQHWFLPAKTGSLSTHTFSMDWDCKKVLHIDPFTSEEYKTPVGSNPTEESTCLLWVTTTDGSSAYVVANATLVQQVLWTELNTQTSS